MLGNGTFLRWIDNEIVTSTSQEFFDSVNPSGVLD
jgi:hypothetical protein